MFSLSGFILIVSFVLVFTWKWASRIHGCIIYTHIDLVEEFPSLESFQLTVRFPFCCGNTSSPILSPVICGFNLSKIWAELQHFRKLLNLCSFILSDLILYIHQGIWCSLWISLEAYPEQIIAFEVCRECPKYQAGQVFFLLINEVYSQLTRTSTNHGTNPTFHRLSQKEELIAPKGF